MVRKQIYIEDRQEYQFSVVRRFCLMNPSLPA